MMRAEDIVLWDGMDVGARRQIKRAGWPEAQLSGEAFVLGRMASAVGDTDGVARSRTIGLRPIAVVRRVRCLSRRSPPPAAS